VAGFYDGGDDLSVRYFVIKGLTSTCFRKCTYIALSYNIRHKYLNVSFGPPSAHPESKHVTISTLFNLCSATNFQHHLSPSYECKSRGVFFPLCKKMLYTEPSGYIAYYSKFPSFYAVLPPLIPEELFIIHWKRGGETWRWWIYYRMYQNRAV